MPASAGSWGTYPPSGPQFKNADGWALQGFTVNEQKRPLIITLELPGSLSLTNIWKRGNETVDNTLRMDDPQVRITIPPGTFTWEIEDETIARVDPGPVPGITDQYIARVEGLRAGKTVLTVTGPQGKTSKTGIVVTEDVVDGTLFSWGTFYQYDEYFAVDDWKLNIFSLSFVPIYDEIEPRLYFRIMRPGDTTTMQVETYWVRENGTPVSDILNGLINWAVEEFTWSVSDESIAYIRDDYPGTHVRSIVALREGPVDVIVTGPLGKTFTMRVYVLPVEEYPDDPDSPDNPDGPDAPGGGGFWEWLINLFTRPPKTALVTSISFNPPSMDMYPGDLRTLTVSVVPWNAAITDVAYSSSDTSIAAVDMYGQVKAIAPGKATITATAMDGSGVKARSP